MLDEINFYRNKGDYGFLSNFYPSPIEIDGGRYATVENYYQSQKAMKEHIRVWIAMAPTPFLAAVAGRSLREDRGEFNEVYWFQQKDIVMMRALLAKFTQNQDLKDKLMATGHAVLHEDSPTDKYWGKLGKDKLGKLLMEVREEIRRRGT